MQFKKPQLELDMEQQTDSKLGKQYGKAIYCHPAYLTYMQSTSCKKKKKVHHAGLDEAQAGIESAGKNISNLRYADGTALMTESKEKLKSLLMKVKEESKNACFKLNIQKTMIMASGPITSRQIDEETMETVTDFILGAPKSLQMVTAALKLKDTCSLEEKL